MYHKLKNQSENIKKLYQSGKHTTEIAKIYGCDVSAIRYHLKQKNVKIRSFSESHRKFVVNEDFFEKIDSEEKAYFLGFLYADGYHNEERYQISMSLQEQDFEILNELNRLVFPKKQLAFYKTSKYNPNSSDQYRLLICNKKISQDLKKLNLRQRKSLNLTYPCSGIVPKELTKPFIRGYFDGDGGICFDKSAKNRLACFYFCGTKEFLTSIINILSKEIGLNKPKLHQKKEQEENSINTFSVRYHGKQIVLKFYNFLYENSSIYMKRKKNKFIEFFDINKL